MTFWISVSTIDPTTGEQTSVPIPSNAGGFQSWADEVYGSPLAVELGLTILPRLAKEGWLEAVGTDLARIRDEAKLLHAHAERLRGSGRPTLNRVDADGTRHNVVVGGADHDDIVAAVRARLDNIVAAAEIAIALGPDRGRLSIT